MTFFIYKSHIYACHHNKTLMKLDIGTEFYTKIDFHNIDFQKKMVFCQIVWKQCYFAKYFENKWYFAIFPLE